MSFNEWKSDLVANNEAIIQIRRHLHKYPEPSFEEKETSALIIDKLHSYGITDIRTEVGNGYGLVATVKGAHPGPTIALRADFDALRIQEETDVEFASVNPGVMHACGHDVHAASLLGVAQVIAKHADQLKGSVVFLFQNAEEVLPGGAKSMVEAGALDGVDKVFGIHSAAQLPVGHISYIYGYGSAAADTFTIYIQGKGGHAASPHLCVDSVMIATEIVTGLQTIVSRNVNPIKPVVVTFGGVDAGGSAFNVIADTAKIVGTIRTLHDDVRKQVKETFISRVKAIAQMHGGSAEIAYIDGYPSILNTDAEVDTVVEVTTALYGAESVTAKPIGMGGEDFSYFLEKKPGAFFNVGGGNDAINANYPHHHPKFKLDERIILQSGEAFLGILAKYLL